MEESRRHLLLFLVAVQRSSSTKYLEISSLFITLSCISFKQTDAAMMVQLTKIIKSATQLLAPRERSGYQGAAAG